MSEVSEEQETKLKDYNNLEERFQSLHLIFVKVWETLSWILKIRVEIDIPEKYVVEKPSGDRRSKRVNVEETGILEILEKLGHLLKLKDKANTQLQSNHSKQLEVVHESLSKNIRILKSDFELVFRQYTLNVVDYCVDYPNIVNSIVKSIELGERADQLNNESGNSNIKFKLKNTFFKELKQRIEKSFHFEYPSSGGEKRKEMPFSKQTKVVEEQVSFIHYVVSYVDPKFPSDFKVAEFCVRSVYVSTLVWLKLKSAVLLHHDDDGDDDEEEGEVGDNNLKYEERRIQISTDPLLLIRWIKEVYPKLFTPYEKKKYIELEPMDHIHDTLSENYVRSSSLTMKRYTKYLIRNVSFSRAFRTRAGPRKPVYTQGPKKLFDRISEYINPLVKIGLRELLCKVMHDIVKDTVIRYSQSLVDEIRNRMDDDPMDVNISSFVPCINDFSTLTHYLHQKRDEVTSHDMLDIVRDEKWIGWMNQEGSVLLEKSTEECLEIMRNEMLRRMKLKLKRLFGGRWVNQTRSNRGVTQDVIVQLAYLLDDLDDLEGTRKKGFSVELQEFCVGEYIRRLYFSKREFGSKEMRVFLVVDMDLFRDEFMFSPELFKPLKTVYEIMRETSEDLKTIDAVFNEFPDFPHVLILELIRKSRAVMKKGRVLKKAKKHLKMRNKGDDESISLFSRINLDQDPDVDSKT